MKRRGMSKWWVVARREWQVAFQSPLAFVLLGLWMLIAGFMFAAILSESQSTDLGPLIDDLKVVLLFIAPLLTMRLLAEERKTGSGELILTAPLSPAQWVVGKYAGAVLVWTIFTAVSFMFALITSRLGVVDWGIVGTSWGGLWLYGATSLAIGLFASALTDNQVVAALISFAVLLLLYLADWAQSASSGWVSTLIGYISLPNHLTDFSLGVVGTSHLVFFFSIIGGFLFLSVRAVDMRRWT